MSTPTTPEAAPGESIPGEPTPRRPKSLLIALTALAAVALLLAGVAIGVAVAPKSASPDTPAASSAAVGFAQDMMRHHQQGVDMATIVLANGVDPQVRSTAYDILTQQTNQIGQMQSWLSRWGWPYDNPNPPMQWMSMTGHDMSGMSMPSMSTMPSTSEMATGGDPPMPGMASTAEMAKLRGLKGTDADLYFLELMRRHHQGGIPMMKYAADSNNVRQSYVRSLAAQMLTLQTNEINTLAAMITERGGTPLPMN